jgi:DNA-binding NarL/FixJ family response regulator
MFKILIVDPNDPFRRSLYMREASDGREGLGMLQCFQPNLIFLEIHLPADSGLDLARRVKIDHPEIIIVILTSYDLPEYRAAAKVSGVEHLVPKDDWTGEDIVALVHTILADLNINDQNHYDRHLPQKHSS